jgi:transcriptional regulator with XRE-family HTH domain
MSFSEKILNLRKSQGLSQISVAKELGVTRQSMYKWESGACIPELDKIKKLAQIYGVTYDYLLNDDIEPLKDDSKASIPKKSPNKKLIVILAVSVAIIILLSIVMLIIVPNLKNDSQIDGPNKPSVQIIPHTSDHELFVAKIYEEPSCEKEGHTLMQCSEPNCDHFELITKVPLGHSMNEEDVCTRCDYIKGSMGIEYATDDGHKYYVKSIGSCVDENIVISNRCNGEDVVAISDFAFSSCPNIVSVKMPSTIVSIGDCAFQECSNLKEVEFSENLKTIGDRAFYRCNMKNVTLPNSVEKIGAYSFYDCKIEYLYMSKNASYIGSYAFYDVSGHDFKLEYNGKQKWSIYHYGSMYGKCTLSATVLNDSSNYVLILENK